MLGFGIDYAAGQFRAVGLRMQPSPRNYGSDQSLLHHLRSADDYRRHHRLCESGQPALDHRRLDYRSVAANRRIPSAAASRGLTRDRVYYFSAPGRAIRPEIYPHRQSDARGDDVDPECDRHRRGRDRLDKKVIAWQEFVCARCGGSSWLWWPRFSSSFYIVGSRRSDCSTSLRRKSKRRRHRSQPRPDRRSSPANWTRRSCSAASRFIPPWKLFPALTQRLSALIRKVTFSI